MNTSQLPWHVRFWWVGVFLCWCMGGWIALGGGVETGISAKDWWSLRPLQRPALPELPEAYQAHVHNPIDVFILAKLQDLHLPPAPPAPRSTLIRRLYFDLLGLPPTARQVVDFERDPDPRAYEKLVDRLLDSPRYGERWARHWLDVVHYGDTHGYDKDKLRPNAWPYRDYVIRAFNEDKPYGRFIQEQIAGDVLFPGTSDGIEALGFIAAGPWDFIGHAEVPETKIDGRIARHLDRDDMVANTINTFLSMTAQCAQCHDHKFDPITQEDYYNLQSVFAALDRADKSYDADAKVATQRAALTRQRDGLKVRLAELERRVQEQGGPELRSLNEAIAKLASTDAKGKPSEFGYHSAIESDPDRTKWVQLDLGREVLVHQIRYAPCHDDFNGIGAGFGFPARFRIELGNQPAFDGQVFIVSDETSRDFSNPGITVQTVDVPEIRARYLRMTATKLAPRQNDYIFALAELEVYDQHHENVARQATVSSLDSIEAPPRWRQVNLVDGLYPGPDEATRTNELERLRLDRDNLLQRAVDAETRTALAQVEHDLGRVAEDLAQLPPPKVVYAGTVYHGSGAFRGTGPDGGKPRAIHVLHRGDVQSPGPEAHPAGLDLFHRLSADFDLPAEHQEGQRRAALARWLSDARNPLTWRSLVNRVWLYHFGRGIVDTPNDFGRMGQRPTHPRLLDWLAVEFRDSGQSIKQLHRLIVNSATYRQSSSLAASDDRVRAEQIDAQNAFLWRMNRRRLEAEAIRDSVLFVSGRLDPSMYGPGFQDFVIEKPEHSPHYQYHLHDPDDPRTHRRSVYRFIVRSQQQPFMTTLDCADPSMLVDKRTESLSALQALTLLNNGLMLTMSKHFATQLDEAGGDLRTQVERGFFQALGRKPSPEELGELTEYARQNGLANTCRLFFNLNEFVFVD